MRRFPSHTNNLLVVAILRVACLLSHTFCCCFVFCNAKRARARICLSCFLLLHVNENKCTTYIFVSTTYPTLGESFALQRITHLFVNVCYFSSFKYFRINISPFNSVLFSLFFFCFVASNAIAVHKRVFVRQRKHRLKHPSKSQAVRKSAQLQRTMI